MLDRLNNKVCLSDTCYLKKILFNKNYFNQWITDGIFRKQPVKKPTVKYHKYYYSRNQNYLFNFYWINLFFNQFYTAIFGSAIFSLIGCFRSQGTNSKGVKPLLINIVIINKKFYQRFSSFF